MELPYLVMFLDTTKPCETVWKVSPRKASYASIFQYQSIRKVKIWFDILCKECSRTGQNLEILGFFNRLSVVPKFSNGLSGFYSTDRGSKSDGFTQGFINPPVPRQLVGKSQIPPNLSPAHTGTSRILSN